MIYFQFFRKNFRPGVPEMVVTAPHALLFFAPFHSSGCIVLERNGFEQRKARISHSSRIDIHLVCVARPHHSIWLPCGGMWCVECVPRYSQIHRIGHVLWFSDPTKRVMDDVGSRRAIHVSLLHNSSCILRGLFRCSKICP